MYNKLFLKRNSKISTNSKIYPFTKVSNSRIDDFTYISYFCNINNVSIGKYCSIAKRVNIGLGFHPTNFISSSPIFYSKINPLKQTFVNKQEFIDSKPTAICNDVWIGVNAIILDGVRIGDGAIIGANSVVTKDVEPYSIVGGVPARLIRKRFSDDIIDALIKLKWWDLKIDFLKQKDVIEIFSKPFTKNSLKILESLIKKIDK